jgi:hypothetical protein
VGFLLVEDDLSDTEFDVVLVFELILLEAVEAVEAVEVVLWPLPVEVDPVDTGSDDGLAETVLLLEAVLLLFDVDVTVTIVTTVGCQLVDLDTEVITSEFDGQGSLMLKKSADVEAGTSEDVEFEEDTLLLLLLVFDIDVIVTVVGCQLESPDKDVITSTFDGQGSSMLKKLTDVGEGIWEEVAFVEVAEDAADDEGFSLSPARRLVSKHLL